MSVGGPNVVIVIPARYASTRLPGKPLVQLAGKPMVQRVYERAKMVKSAARVIVATDDERILKAVEGFGGEARMNLPGTVSGNWKWRYVSKRLTKEIGEQLRQLTLLYDR